MQEKPYTMELGHAKCTDLCKCMGVDGRGFGIDFALGLARHVILVSARGHKDLTCSIRAPPHP